MDNNDVCRLFRSERELKTIIKKTFIFGCENDPNPPEDFASWYISYIDDEVVKQEMVYALTCVSTPNEFLEFHANMVISDIKSFINKDAIWKITVIDLFLEWTSELSGHDELYYSVFKNVKVITKNILEIIGVNIDIDTDIDWDAINELYSI